MSAMRRILWLVVLLCVGGTSLQAACPCMVVICKCCIDRCRVGFFKMPQDGCRNRGGTEAFSVVMKVTPRGTEVRSYQGAITYSLAKSVWSGAVSETAPAIAQGVKQFLGYDSPLANIQNIVDGSWGNAFGGSDLERNTPWMFFAPMGTTGAPSSAASKAGITGQLYVLNLATADLSRSRRGAPGLEYVGKAELLDEAGATTRNIWLNTLNGRRGSGPDPMRSDFGFVTKNEDYYHWRNCTDSVTCTAMFVLAIVVAVIAIVICRKNPKTSPGSRNSFQRLNIPRGVGLALQPLP